MCTYIYIERDIHAYNIGYIPRSLNKGVHDFGMSHVATAGSANVRLRAGGLRERWEARQSCLLLSGLL